MLFCSWNYLVFFVLVMCAYWAFPWDRPRVYLLLAASYFFYASWSSWLALVIFCSATLDYFLALGIARTATSPQRSLGKVLVSISVVGNLGLLCYFKYANFFLDSLRAGLATCGVSAPVPVLEVILPIGISFYTFEAINYVVDVYRGKVPVERNLANFLLFILFFPHLIAGPIVRARDFLPQIRRRKRWSWRRVQSGVQLILLGLIKKLVIADRLALLADPVFSDPELYRTSACWLALVGYAMQLYGDFSGYSDLAMGSAYLLGYHLSWNFRMPYLAANMSEFWRRWHISLSSWLRDYLFFPLGGSRGGRWQTYRNLLITMTLCGLWHGASWTCILFGVMHGVLLIVHRGFQEFCAKRPGFDALVQTSAGLVVRIALTFCMWNASLLFFRCQGLATVAAFASRLMRSAPGTLAAPLPNLAFVLAGTLLIAGHALGQRRLGQRLLARLPAGALGAGYGMALALILVLAPPAGQGFIYFQF